MMQRRTIRADMMRTVWALCTWPRVSYKNKSDRENAYEQRGILWMRFFERMESVFFTNIIIVCLILYIKACLIYPKQAQLARVYIENKWSHKDVQKEDQVLHTRIWKVLYTFHLILFFMAHYTTWQSKWKTEAFQWRSTMPAVRPHNQERHTSTRDRTFLMGIILRQHVK